MASLGKLAGLFDPHEYAWVRRRPYPFIGDLLEISAWGFS
jgi:hypothetical protein